MHGKIEAARDRLFPSAQTLPNDDSGQTMVEYVMLIVLVALAAFLLSPNLKDAIRAVFVNTSSAMK